MQELVNGGSQVVWVVKLRVGIGEAAGAWTISVGKGLWSTLMAWLITQVAVSTQEIGSQVDNLIFSDWLYKLQCLSKAEVEP